jgi:hypothetical protein
MREGFGKWGNKAAKLGHSLSAERRLEKRENGIFVKLR